jgi:choline kinase
MTHTLVLAAGNSLPAFRDAGFGVPKSLIKIDGREVLFRAIDSYAVDTGALTVLVSKTENDEFELERKTKIEFPTARVLAVPSGSKGALISALFGVGDLDLDEPLVIASGDSAVTGGIDEFVQTWTQDQATGATLVFPSQDSRYSYIVVDGEGNVAQVVEKKVAGPLATTGVFYFESVSVFIRAATWCLVNNASLGGTFFNSTAVNYLVEQGHDIDVGHIEAKAFHLWSVPSDFPDTKWAK